MELCPDKLSYFIEDISTGLSVINSLKPKKYFQTKNLYDCSSDNCYISSSTNSKGKKKIYCCADDISYTGLYSAGYFADDISNNTKEFSYFIEQSRPVKLYDMCCFNGENYFYYIKKEVLGPYQTKAIQELHQLVLTQASTIAALESRISTLENT